MALQEKLDSDSDTDTESCVCWKQDTLSEMPCTASWDWHSLSAAGLYGWAPLKLCTCRCASQGEPNLLRLYCLAAETVADLSAGLSILRRLCTRRNSIRRS